MPGTEEVAKTRTLMPGSWFLVPVTEPGEQQKLMKHYAKSTTDDYYL